MDIEIKEVILLAVSAIMLSIVFGFISIVWSIQGDISTARNNEMEGNINMMQHKEYSKYNKNELVGEEVIECITTCYDKGITIYIDSDDITHHVYNMENYTNPATKKYFYASEGGDLMRWFPNSKKYRAYLVYNCKDPKEVCEGIVEQYRAKAETKYFANDSEKLELLDNIAWSNPSNLEVTGIIIIDYSKIL